jgi:hypothetical protein
MSMLVPVRHTASGSASHWVEPVHAVVPATSAYCKTSRTSEKRCVSYDYLTGPALRMWWCQRLPHPVKARVPVRYTVCNAALSPARAFVCGGVNDSRISKNRLHQRDVDERLSAITSISLDRSSACSNISALCMGIGTQYQ